MASFGFSLDLRRRRRAHGIVAPLEGFAGQLYATFGLSRLLSAHGGPCLRVRRGSDGGEADIGFTGSGALDTGALLAFAGAASAYATRWYDQTGGGRDAVQTAGAAQPRIVNAGVLDVGPNGRPCLAFSGAQYLDIQNSVEFSRNQPALTYAVIARIAGTGGTQVLLYYPITSTVGSVRGYIGGTTMAISAQMRTADASSPATSTAAVASGSWNRLVARGRHMEGALDLAINGALPVNSALTPAQRTPDTNQAANIRVGATTSGGAYLTGGIAALALAQSALDMAALDAAQVQVML
ncbi:LamG-like jellyroll fold domain-containing protein [Ancylobacter polymorphus]|uniref:Uncharacterized protein n=1 Tax=Ancylobacter polymorphus TaxID=223390 RepID=A0ABU0BEP6_9HYPH|nr:hypothetical protein [Ancylobacter polymorphus]MDQ0303758.1 hypothetical protein [Ancylobacter polymorphus]